MVELIVNSFEDYDKLINGGNVAAGGRVRKAAMEAINALKDIRKEIQATRNSIATTRATGTTVTTGATGTTGTTGTTATWPPTK